MSDVAGRHTALTWTALLRPLGHSWVFSMLSTVRVLPFIAKPLVEMRVLHYARWTLLTRLPGEDAPLAHPCLLFESNFDTDLRQYIEVFASVVPIRFSLVWFRSFGFPGLFPSTGFHAWVTQNSTVAGVYYAAYPETTTRGVISAMAVSERLARFRGEARQLGDAAFAAAYEQLVVDLQGEL